MKKRYIIKDRRKTVRYPNGANAEFGFHVSKHLVEQINGIEGTEGTAMQESLVKNTKGLSAVIPKDNDGYCTV